MQIKKGTDDDKTAYLDTDRFTFEGKSKGKLSVGKIYIQNEDNAENGMDIETKQNVLSGGKVTFENSSKLDDDKVDFTKATSAFTYDVQVSDKTVALKRTGNTDDDTLYKMDEREGSRQFSFKEKYQSDKSLDNTENGTLLVYGETKGERSDVLSGKLSGKETEKGSFFNIGSDVTTHLELSDMTISDADSSSIGGSVLHNDSETSKVVIQNVDIKDNSASAGNGGAIYNNGGDESQSQPGSSDFKGLFVNDVHFSNNKASDKGGALYNDTNGYTILQNVEVDAATGDAKNDIYNGGYMEVTNGGKVNKFNSDIENAGTLNFYSVSVGDEDGSNITSLNNTSSGTVTFGGYNTIVDLTNEGTVNFGSDGEYTIPTENNLTGTFTNSKTAVNNSVLNVSGEKAKLENKTGGTFTNKDELYIEENAQLNNEADIQNEGMISVDAGSVVKGSESGTITNKGGFDLEGDASEYKGKYTQSDNDDSITQVDKGAKFFNGDTSITAGTLNWFTENDLSDDAKLTVSGDNTRLVVGTGVDNSNLTLKNGSSVDSKVTLFEGSTINIGQESSSSESSLKIKDDSYWGGTINVDENGSLVISSNTPTQGEKSVLNAKKGSVNIEKGSLYLANGSSIAGDVKTTIGDNTTLYIDENAEVTLNEGDTTKGHTLLNGGTLNYEKGVTTDGENVTLEAHTGKLSVQNGGQLQLNAEKSIVDGDVDITITSDSSVDINGGTLQIDDEDTWEGAITLDDGTLNYHAKKSGTFHANKGNLNLLKDSVLTIVDPSVVKDEVVIDIQKGSTVDIENGKFHLDESDKWNGLIKNNNGELTVSGIDNTKGHAGGLQQNGGKSEFTDNANIVITDKNSYIDGGDVTISENSNLTFGKGSKKLNVDSLTMTNDSTLGVKNHVIHDINVGDMTVEGKNNVTVDLNPRKHKNDKFIIDELTSDGGGSLNVSEFSFSGGAPIDKKIKFQIFDAENVSDNITFTSSITKIKSPIGNYGLKSLGDGIYEASFKSFNPQVYRGQVATLAAYTHQLMVDDMITNHFVLHNDNFMNNAKNSNKYAAGGALFAPYQNTYEDGGLWAKTYVSLNKMDLTHNLRVGNNIWGTLAGADLPAVELNKDWKFIPTGYIGYNAGHQHFNGVSMQQNGGQLGVMGTFIKDNDFITSVTAYGGGYTNDMDVAGYQDDTGNWFAGTAVKTAYNFHPFRDFIFQPNLFAAYNAFGKQNWGTDFGIMSMSSNMLNGVNVAPGANFIYNKKTWSLYATLQYMYFINDKIGGQAGNIGLPNVRMDHGYIQYGIGGTKTWSDRLGAYGQVTMRNAGVTGIGFQFGINYLFDIMPKKKINAYNQEIPSTYIKKVYKPLDNLTSANKPVS